MKPNRLLNILVLATLAATPALSQYRHRESPAETARKARIVREMTARFKRFFSAYRSGDSVAVKLSPVFKSLSKNEARGYSTTISPTSVSVQFGGVEAGTLRFTVSLRSSDYNASLARDLPGFIPRCQIGRPHSLQEGAFCVVPTYAGGQNAFAVVQWTKNNGSQIEIVTAGVQEIYGYGGRRSVNAMRSANTAARAAAVTQ